MSNYCNNKNNYQLFGRKPNKQFIQTLVSYYGVKDLDSKYRFTLRDLEKLGTVSKITEHCEDLREYYLNCKYIKYVQDLNEKKCITILRHFLKLINYKVISREKYSNNSKYLLYEIVNCNEDEKLDLCLSFD